MTQEASVCKRENISFLGRFGAKHRQLVLLLALGLGLGHKPGH
jgi:hypothetical protein